jgi:hypothetical protein
MIHKGKEVNMTGWMTADEDSFYCNWHTVRSKDVVVP